MECAERDPYQQIGFLPIAIIGFARSRSDLSRHHLKIACAIGGVTSPCSFIPGANQPADHTPATTVAGV